MSDLVKRLRENYEALRGPDYYEAAAIIEAQAAEIETKTQAVADLARAIFELNTRAEQAESALAKAVEVLRPFSTLASDYIDRGLDEDDHVLAGRIVRNNETASPPRVTFADFRRCRAFITEHGSDSNSPPIREA